MSPTRSSRVLQGHPARHAGVISALLAAMAAAAIGAFYVFIQYGQNPSDLQVPRVRFWIAYTGIIALACAVGAIDLPRSVRAAVCSLAAWGSLVCFMVGILSIGPLFFRTP